VGLGHFGMRVMKVWFISDNKRPSTKKSLNHVNHLTTNNIPIGFVEDGRYVIWPKGFQGAKAENNRLNLIIN